MPQEASLCIHITSGIKQKLKVAMLDLSTSFNISLIFQKLCLFPETQVLNNATHQILVDAKVQIHAVITVQDLSTWHPKNADGQKLPGNYLQPIWVNFQNISPTWIFGLVDLSCELVFFHVIYIWDNLGTSSWFIRWIGGFCWWVGIRVWYTQKN